MTRAYTRYARPAPPRKPPTIPLEKAVDIAIVAIERANGVSVAVFMAGGKIKTTRTSTSTFDTFMHHMPGGLVGVYDDEVNEAALQADIQEFYKVEAA